HRGLNYRTTALRGARDRRAPRVCRRLARREAIERGEQVGAQLVGAPVARPVEGDETRRRPHSAELPGSLERGREILAAVDQHSGEAAESPRVAQDGALLEPGAVREVV